jgi:hypothetical protein
VTEAVMKDKKEAKPTDPAVKTAHALEIVYCTQ